MLRVKYKPPKGRATVLILLALKPNHSVAGKILPNAISEANSGQCFELAGPK